MISLEEFLPRFSEEVRRFNTIVERPEADADESLKELSACLSRLLDLGERCPDSYSDDDTDAPIVDQNAVRAMLAANFASFGFYYLAPPGEPTGEGTIHVGDAIDDLLDIRCNLNEALFHMNHGVGENCAWYARLQFPHWGRHAINLKRYLHYRIHDW